MKPPIKPIYSFNHDLGSERSYFGIIWERGYRIIKHKRINVHVQVTTQARFYFGESALEIERYDSGCDDGYDDFAHTKVTARRTLTTRDLVEHGYERVPGMVTMLPYSAMGAIDLLGWQLYTLALSLVEFADIELSENTW